MWMLATVPAFAGKIGDQSDSINGSLPPNCNNQQTSAPCLFQASHSGNPGGSTNWSGSNSSGDHVNVSLFQFSLGPGAQIQFGSFGDYGTYDCGNNISAIGIPCGGGSFNAWTCTAGNLCSFDNTVQPGTWVFFVTDRLETA